MLTGAFLHYHHKGLTFIQTINRILTTELANLITEIKESEAEKANIYVNSFDDLKPETRGGIYTELCQYLRLYVTDKDIENALSKKKYITPTDLESADIYITIPEEKIDEWKNLLTLMINQFLKHFEKRNEKAELTPILFLLDEFARLGEIEKVTKSLGTLRSKKITLALMVQNLSQLDSIYGENKRESICGNCIYTAVLQVTDYKTQEYFSKRIGTHDVIKKTIHKNYEPYSNFEAGHGESETTEEKRRFKPELFGKFDDIIILFPFGRGVARLKKIHYNEINIDDIKE